MTESGVILRNGQIVVPQKLQQRMIDLAQVGHQSATKTNALLREVWFPSMNELVDF